MSTQAPDVAPSSRNDIVTTACGHCGHTFTPTGRQTWCSPACRVAAWRRRHAQPVQETPLAPSRSRRRVTVYECDICGERAIGEQYCAECRTFMHRVGIGGCCPNCDAPLAISELVEADA